MATMETVRMSSRLIQPTKRMRWVVLAALALVVSGLEALGALLIFALMGVITRPEKGFVLPGLGDLNSRFPGIDPDRLLLYALVFVGVFFVVRGAVFLLQVYLQHRVAYNAGVLLSERLLKNYLRMPYVLHLQRNSAELIRNANESVDVIARFVFVPAVALLADALLVLAVLAVLLVAAPLPTLLAVAVLGPLVFVLLRSLQPRMESLGVEGQVMAKESLQWIQQSLQGIRDIRLIRRARYFESQYATRKATLARAYYLQATYVSVPRIALETIFVIFILVFLGFTILGPGTLDEAISILGLFAYAVLRVMPAVNRMIGSVNMFKFGSAAVGNVASDLEYEPDDEVIAASLPFKDRISVIDVSFTYPGTAEPVIDGITLDIRAGESLGIVGTTGSGKSTLVDLLLGLLDPSTGVIQVDGVDISGRIQEWQASLGVVSQTVFLIDDSLRRNIALGIDDSQVDETRMTRAISSAQLQPFVESLPDGLDTLIGERGVRLSGGQRQRVSIARALYLEPSVLILDEGTSALDNETEALVIDAIGQAPSRTVIAVAHRLTTVERCDRIIVLKEGKIEDMGTHSELLGRSPVFRKLVEAGNP